MSEGGFDPAWLALREPADARARDEGLVRQLHRWRPAPWRIVDLGCGTGANGRWLAPRLDGRQDWRLVDGDARLLAHGAARTREWARRLGFAAGADAGGSLQISAGRFQAAFRPLRSDLRGGLRATLAGADAVTASALLDLVSEDWLAGLIAACRANNAACLFALSYDGALAWGPGDVFDTTVRRLFNDHQRRDKGFGPALGPAAGERTAALLHRAGYRVTVRPSPWRLAGREWVLQRALLDGIAGACSRAEIGRAHV